MRKLVILSAIFTLFIVGFLSGCIDSMDTQNEYKRFGEYVYCVDPAIHFTINGIKTSVDYITVSDSGYIYVYKPSKPNYGYLWLYFVVWNDDDEIVDSPSTYWMSLLVSGTEVPEDPPSYSIPDLYDDSKKINPGAKNEGWIVYSIPKNAKNVQFVYEFSNGYAIWNISDSQIVFQERNLSNLSDGESITFGSEQDYFELSISYNKTVKSYSYRGFSGYVHTEYADPGYKFVFITVTAKNMGTKKINVPSAYDIKLIAGGKQYSYKGYYGENSYQDVGGTLYPGVAAEGYLVFEIPDNITNATIVVELTSEVEAEWVITV